MNEEKALLWIKEIKRKINATKILTGILVAAVCFFLPINFAYRFITAAATAFAAMIIMSKIRNDASDILYEECEPQTYYAVVHGIYPDGATAFADMQTAYFIGDFKSAAGIASSQLHGRLSSAARLQYMYMLAACAFLAGDFDLCREMCAGVKGRLSKLKIKGKIKTSYFARCDFFLNFIDCDYAAALKCLDICTSVDAKKQKNTYKFMMCYYIAVTLYYNNRTEEAKAQFEIITDAAPDLFIFEKARLYIKAIENNAFQPIENIPLREIYESSTATHTLTKEEKRKAVRALMIILVCGCIVFLCIKEIPGIAKGAPYDVINSEYAVNEICQSVVIDDDYTLYIFTTQYDEIGVAYLKNHGDNNYSYCISYIAAPEIYLEEDSGYYICADGKAKKVYFDITDNKTAVPKDSRVTEFEHKGKAYYFYIFKTEEKNSFTASSGVN